MTLKSRLPLHIYQKYFKAKDSFDAFYNKLEVITDSTAILYSIRILIVVIALLMGYVHSPKEVKEFSKTQKTEVLKKQIPFDKIN